MREKIGSVVGYTGLAMLSLAGLYLAFQAAARLLPFMWAIAVSGDVGAIVAMVGVVGFVLLFVGATIYPDKSKAAA